jgi:hypothetical protein
MFLSLGHCDSDQVCLPRISDESRKAENGKVGFDGAAIFKYVEGSNGFVHMMSV